MSKVTLRPAKKPAPKPTPPNPWFEIRRSRIQGRGGFASRYIPRGTRIIEYTGERIDGDEADRRYVDSEMERHHTFLFALEDGMNIDAAVGGNEARFINHSCDPNCVAFEEKGRVFIEAVRDIEPGEELFYDYAYILTGRRTKADEAFYACRCGTAKCRGTILAPRPKRRRAKKRTSAGQARKAARRRT